MNTRLAGIGKRMMQVATGPRGQAVAQRFLSGAQRWIDFLTGRQRSKAQSQSENGENSLLNREICGSSGKETK